MSETVPELGSPDQEELRREDRDARLDALVERGQR